MNGLIKITLAGKAVQLTFGMMAIEEIGNRHHEGAGGWFKMITDIVYGGYINDTFLEGKAPELSYRQIAETVEDLITEDSKVLTEVFKCFMDSKAGKTMAEAIKKKTNPPLKKEKNKTGMK
jgi:hypothetical protein